MSGISNSLPALITGPDRLLPVPALRSPSTRSSDGMPSYGDMLSNNIMSSNKSLNNNSVSENAGLASPFARLSQSSSDAVTQAPMGCSSQTLSASHQPADMYSHNGSARLYEPIITSSSDDLHSGSYGVASPGSKRPSHRSQTEGSGTSPQGDLSSGHSYIPYQQQSYPAPPIDLPAPTPHLSSDTSIQAGA